MAPGRWRRARLVTQIPVNDDGDFQPEVFLGMTGGVWDILSVQEFFAYGQG